MGCSSKTGLSEDGLVRIAKFVCAHSPGNILLIGGGCILSETAGYRRMRGLSDDLDFIVNDEGLDAVRVPLNLGDTFKNGEQASGGNVSYINDVLVGFFHDEIKGWKIPDSVFERPRIVNTAAGPVYMIPAELNLALKVRRGASRSENPHIYGKDSLDAASMVLGMQRRKEEFSIPAFLSYLVNGACASCNLSTYGECTSSLRDSEKQLFGEDRSSYSSFIDSCESSLNGRCTK